MAYAGAEDVDRAVRAAREAFEDGRWSKIAAAERTRAMLAFADAVEAHLDELAELESLDNGKPVKLARRVDVPLTAAHLRYFAGWPTRINGEVLPVAQPNMHCYTRKEPVGVAGADHPVELPAADGGLEGRARAGGRLHDRAQARRADAAHGAAVRRARARGRHPRGRAERDHGRRRDRAPRSWTTPSVDKIAFTGSTVVGREIGEKAGRALKRVTLELGGKSPNIILPTPTSTLP